MTTCQAVAEVLDETIKALASMDLESLAIQEKRIARLAKSPLMNQDSGMALLLAKKRALELLLHGSALNLNALNRLHQRNTRDPWEL